MSAHQALRPEVGGAGSPPPGDVSLILDDDPTGTQAVAGVRVHLRFTPATIRDELGRGEACLHLITNSRALTPRRAGEVTSEAAVAARAAAPDARIVLRGDSTLRGHLLEEYLAVDPAESTVLLLVPALPAAGRTTRGGVHCIERDGRNIPLHETEYAVDGEFRYTTARLRDWAQERSGGLFAAERGTEVPLDRLRSVGPASVAEALATAAAAGPPAVCVPDAESLDDLSLIAAGLREAEAAGVPVTVRCAAAFAAVLSGCRATDAVPPPASAGVLVVCGSYIEATTGQLAALGAERSIFPIELDPQALAGDEGEAARALAEAAASAQEALGHTGLAVVAMARERPPETRTLGAGTTIAQRFARLVGLIDPLPSVVVAKGGITSYVTLRDGLGVDAATVVGPLLPGVSLWDAQIGVRSLHYVVVPGNVGGPGLLVELLDLLGATS